MEESNNEARNSDGQYNKRWLIAKVPGPDQYQIINSHYGVLIGGFACERYGNWLVKADPISTDGQATRWKAEEVGNGYGLLYHHCAFSLLNEQPCAIQVGHGREPVSRH